MNTPSLPFPIVGARTMLRPFVVEDADDMLSVYGDAAAMRYVAWGAPVVDAAGVRSMLEQYIDHQQRHGYACWAVVHATSGALIGDAGFVHHDDGRVELGYTLSPAWWGQGYATEVAALCVTVAFEKLGVDRLTAVVDPGNPASARVLAKLGFRQVGEREIYGRTHLDYELERP